MGLKFLFPNAREWRYIIESLRAIIDEASFTAAPEGLKLRALDPSKVAMVDLLIPQNAFEEYEVDGEVRIGVNFDDLVKVIKRGKSDERIVFETTENRLRVSFVGRAVRTFSLPLIDVIGEELPEPRTTFTVKARMLSDAFRDVLKDVELVSDNVKFIGEEDGLKIQARGDRGEVEAKFSIETGSLLEYDVTEPSSSLYGVDFLLNIVGKAYRISELTTLEFGTNKPLALTFDVASGGILKYYLAPRME